MPFDPSTASPVDAEEVKFDPASAELYEPKGVIASAVDAVGGAVKGAYAWASDKLPSTEAAATEPQGEPNQDIVTSARSWQGAGAGRGSGVDPRRLDIPKKRESVLEGLDMPEPQFNAAEAERLSKRDYAEQSQRNLDNMAAGIRPQSIGPTSATVKPIPEDRLGWTLEDKYRKSLGGAILETAGDAVRGSIMGAEGMSSGAWDTLYAASEQVGGLGNFGRLAKEAGKAGRDSSESWGNTQDPKSVTQSVFQSTVQSLMAAGLTGGFGNASIAIQAGISGANAYGEAREAGKSNADSLERAAVNTFAEFIGEKVALPGLQKAMKQIGAGGSAKEFAKTVAEWSGKELGGEEFTTSLENLYEKFGSGGLRPNMTMTDHIEDMVQTFKVTLGQSLLMGGVGTGANAIHRATETPARALSRELDAGNVTPLDFGQTTLNPNLQRQPEPAQPVTPEAIASVITAPEVDTVDKAIAAANTVVSSTPSTQTLTDAQIEAEIARLDAPGYTQEDADAAIAAMERQGTRDFQEQRDFSRPTQTEPVQTGFFTPTENVSTTPELSPTPAATLQPASDNPAASVEPGHEPAVPRVSADEVRPAADVLVPTGVVPEQSPTDALTKPVEESVQEKSHREWGENYNQVINAPDLAKVDAKSLDRAIGYGESYLGQLKRQGWDGSPVNQTLIDQIQIDVDAINAEAKTRRKAAEQSTPAASTQSAPIGVTYDYTQNKSGNVTVKGDPAEIRAAFTGLKGATFFADGKPAGVMFSVPDSPAVLERLKPSDGDVKPIDAKPAIEKITTPISYDAARALVAGKTEKPGGVDPVRQIDSGEGNKSTYRIGDVPLSMFRENESGALYDGTVGQELATDYSQRDTKDMPPVIAVLSPKTGKLNILDGGHRITAARMRGDETISTIISFKPTEKPSATSSKAVETKPIQAQAPEASGRPGYDTEVEVSAKSLQVAFERDSGEPLVSKPDKLAAWRNGTSKTNTATSPVEVGFTDGGKFSVNDGRHRIALAAERGENIKVMVDGNDVDKLKAMTPTQPTARETAAVGPFKAREADKEAQRLTDTTGTKHIAVSRERVDNEGYTVSEWFVEPVPEKKGLTLDEAKAHVAQVNIDRPLGGSWDKIGQMQGGRLDTSGLPTAPQPTAREAAVQGEIERAKAESEAAKAARSEKPKQEGLTIGKAPGSAEPVSVKDGIVHIGKYPAQNYETGEDVKVPAEATNEQIAQAIRDSGAITKGTKIFGLTPTPIATIPVSQRNAVPDLGHLGRDNQPINEGGKPFKVKAEAQKAKKQQPMMRVKAVKGGFVLAPKTDAQIAANEAAGRRLARGTTGDAGMPMSAHGFIAREGGLSKDHKSDLGVEGNPRIGNLRLYAGTGGLTIEQASERLKEAGYLQPEATHTDAFNLIRKSLQVPQYTPEGFERVAQMESEQRFQDHLEAQQEVDPAQSLADLEYEMDDTAGTGYNEAADPIKVEVNALLAQADALGIDTDKIKEQAYEDTRNGSEQDYYEAARAALKAAIEGSAGNRSADSGEQGNARSQDLLGDKPNASQQAAADILAAREKKQKDALANAPAFEGLDMVDSRNGNVVAPGQQEIGQEPPADPISAAVTALQGAVNDLAKAIAPKEVIDKVNDNVVNSEAFPGTDWKGRAWDGKRFISDEARDSEMRPDYIGSTKNNAPYENRAGALGRLRADDYKLADTHEIVQVGKDGYAVRPKESAYPDYAKTPGAQPAQPAEQESADYLPKGWKKDGSFYEFRSASGSEFTPTQIAGVVGGTVTKQGMHSLIGVPYHAWETAKRKLKEAGMWGAQPAQPAGKVSEPQKPYGDKSPSVKVTTINTSDITGVEHPIRNKELRRIADAVLRDIRAEIAAGGNPLTNEETGWSFSIASRDLSKMGNNPHMKPESSKAAVNAREIVNAAVLAETHSDTHGHGADVVHRFYAPAMIDGNLYRVRLTVLDFNETRGRRNLHAILAVEIENAPLGTLQPADASKETATAAQPTTGRTVSIADLLLGVKREDGKPLMGNYTVNEPSPIWRSALADGIDSMNVKAQHQEGWRAQIQGMVNKGAVKADEVEWSGLTDWLKLQQGKVTKEQVSNYLAQNGVQITETVLGELSPEETGETAKRAELASMSDEELADEAESAGVSPDNERRLVIDDIISQYLNDGAENDMPSAPKYATYQLPGGENYREVLLTLPVVKQESEAFQKAKERLQRALDEEKEAGSDVVNRGDLSDETDLAQRIVDRHRQAYEEQPQGYKSAHWDQPNVLAHIRVNDRTDASGAKVLFVEEIQSDWGQAGKKKGIDTGGQNMPEFLARATYESAGEGSKNWRWKLPDGTGGIQPSRAAAEQAAADSLNNRQRTGVPNAPFVGKTDAWVSLALKRIIKMAVDGGYDKVAFVNGEQSAERYDLSKQVDQVTAYKNDDGSFQLSIIPKGRQSSEPVINIKDAAELEATIGKDLAKQIIDDKGSMNVYRGLDLKVGGEGMKAFYDQIVPSVTKNVLRKLGGGKMEVMKLSSRLNDGARPESIVRADTKQEAYKLLLADGKFRGIFESREEANDELVRQQKEYDAAGQTSFTITDAMKEHASKGMPLFEPQQAYNNFRGQLDLFLNSQPDPSQAGARLDGIGKGIEAAKRDAVVAVEDLHATGSVLARTLSSDLAAKQRTNLVGQTVANHHDLAVLAQLYRDERFETFRVIFTDKNDKVVSQVGVTSRLPGSVEVVIGPDVGKYISDITATAKQAGATSYSLLHNHPSGKATPSSNDEFLTKNFDRQFAMQGLAFKGHVVIDTNEYAVISSRGDSTIHKKDFGAVAPTLHPQFGGFKIAKPDDIMQLARLTGADTDGVTLIVTDHQYRTKAVTTLPSSAITSNKSTTRLNLLKVVMRSKGSMVFAVSRNEPLLRHLSGMVVDGVYVAKDGSMKSLATLGVISSKGAFPESRRTRVSADTSAEFNYLREASQRVNPYGAAKVSEPSRSVITGQTLPESWQAPDASKMDDFIYSMQDKHVDTKRVMKAVREAIGAIADQQDPYLQEELFHGRAAMAVKEFLEKQVRPLITDLQARGVDMSDFEEYLHNRHAERRNVQVAKANPAMQDGGSGIKTADARAYLAALPADKQRAYTALAAKVDQINRDTRALLVSSGLEKQETIDAWQAAYGDEYVPLMREEMENGHGIGQGFSVRGSASKRAMGSDKPVANILANIMLAREKAITRSEKRKIGEALYGLVLEAPNPNFWLAIDPALQNVKNPNQIMATQLQLIDMGMDPADAEAIAKEPTTRYINPKTGLVESRINPAMRSAENVLAVRIDGEDKYVFFNKSDERAMRMAKALKNLDADQLGQVMGTVAKMTRYFAAVNTQYNPVFGVTNIIRDVQTAMLNLQSTALKGKQKDVLKNILPALRGIYIDLRDHRAGKQPTSAYAQVFEEFQREGGATGYRDMYANAEERADAIKAEIEGMNAGKLKQVGKGVMGWLSDYNEAMENAVRVSAYMAAKEHGMSNQQAASLAKNLTVNFNRKGQVALQAGALYAFFNASVQGSARMGQTLFEGGKLSKVGKQIITGGLLLGAMQALLLAAAGFDDDEPPDFVRERNLVIPIGGKKYVTIPMPLGFHIIPNLARIPTEWAMGGFKNTPKRIGQLFGLLADGLNPIGSSTAIQTLSPTIIDPFVALSENKDWTGKPIAKKDFDSMHPTAGHTRAKDTATPWAKFISKAVNYATGGTEYKPGVLSPTPDQIDYLVGQATGGVGREIGKLAQVGGATIQGDEIPLYKVPLVGRFVGTTEGQAAESSRFYENLKSIGTHKAQIDGLKRDHKGGEIGVYVRDNPEARMLPMATKFQEEVSKLNHRKRELIKQGASAERIKIINMQITARMAQFNQQVRRMEESAK